MENLGQRTSVTDYANQFSGLLLEVPEMHPADAVYRFVRGAEAPDPPPRGAPAPNHCQRRHPLGKLLTQHCTSRGPPTLSTGRHLHPTYMGPQPMQLGALTRPPKLSPAERERLYREGRCGLAYNVRWTVGSETVFKGVKECWVKCQVCHIYSHIIII